MKIYNTYYYDDEGNKITQPFFTTKEKAKNYFWNMLPENEQLSNDFKELFDEYGNENESFKDFVYIELNGQDWDFCGTDENEVID